MEKNVYSGTILVDTYNPIVFRLPQDQVFLLSAENTETQDELLSSVSKGLSKLFNPSEVEYSFDDVLKQADSAVNESLGFWLRLYEWLYKKRELSELMELYYLFVKQAKKDFKDYERSHEVLIQCSASSVDVINNKKTLMKDYLLQELSEQLKKSGLNGEFREFDFERLDLRQWPLEEKYRIVHEDNLKLIEYSELYQQNIDPVFSIVENRLFVRNLKKRIEELKPKSSLNYEQMKSDIEQLAVFSKALSNIERIYSETLDRLKPIMKELLKNLEQYAGDVDSMPSQQADALYKIKELFKGLTEKRIIPISEDTPYIYTNVCEYSNELSMQYNRIRETIYQNFC